MKVLLITLAATSFGLAAAEAEMSADPYSKLIGTWKCSTSYEDGTSITRLINETVFEASGRQTEIGSIQWFDSENRVTASYQTVSEVRLKDDLFFVDLQTLNVGQTRFLGTTSNSQNSITQFNDSVEANLDRDTQSRFDVVELNQDRFVATGQEDGTFNVCVRKG